MKEGFIVMEKKKYEFPSVEVLKMQLTDTILDSIDQDQNAEDIPGVGNIQLNQVFRNGDIK